MNNSVLTRTGQPLEAPRFVNFLFDDKRSALLWLIVRVWLGWQWAESGLGKLRNPDWMSGEALKGFWSYAITIPEQGRPPIAYDWYRSFIESMLNSGSYIWFAKLVAVGEIIVGIALIVGLFVGISAFLAGFMNWNFIMAGAASVNGVFFGLAVFLVMAWKVSGYFGLDYFVLPRLASLWSTEKKA